MIFAKEAICYDHRTAAGKTGDNESLDDEELVELPADADADTKKLHELLRRYYDGDLSGFELRNNLFAAFAERLDAQEAERKEVHPMSHAQLLGSAFEDQSVTAAYQIALATGGVQDPKAAITDGEYTKYGRRQDQLPGPRNDTLVYVAQTIYRQFGPGFSSKDILWGQSRETGILHFARISSLTNVLLDQQFPQEVIALMFLDIVGFTGVRESYRDIRWKMQSTSKTEFIDEDGRYDIWVRMLKKSRKFEGLAVKLLHRAEEFAEEIWGVDAERKLQLMRTALYVRRASARESLGSDFSINFFAEIMDHIKNDRLDEADDLVVKTMYLHPHIFTAPSREYFKAKLFAFSKYALAHGVLKPEEEAQRAAAEFEAKKDRHFKNLARVISLRGQMFDAVVTISTGEGRRQRPMPVIGVIRDVFVDKSSDLDDRDVDKVPFLAISFYRIGPDGLPTRAARSISRKSAARFLADLDKGDYTNFRPLPEGFELQQQ